MTLVVAAMVLAAAGPAVAQVTTPGPDFNNDGFGDLAVGVPGEDVGAVDDAGVVNVRYAPGFGRPVGLTVLTQDRPETGDESGSALAEGFLASSDGTVDLAVGAPGERVGSAAGAGAVSVVKTDDSGFLATVSQFFYQGVSGLGGTAESGDVFGAAFS
jgi:hypothetical protein